MTENLYTARNYSSVAAHYAGAGLIATGAFLVAAPWAIGAGILITAGVHHFLARSYIKFIESKLVVHPDIHKFSPNLGKIAEDLYKKSGISSDKYPIYDFRADDVKSAKEDSILNGLFKEIGNLAAQTPNAAALRTGKTTIMISEPLLKLLDDEEEKAVLAHEFAHAMAKHSYVTMVPKLTGSVAVTAVGLTLMAAAISTGVTGIAAWLASNIVITAAFARLHKNGHLSKVSKKDRTLKESADFDKMKDSRSYAFMVSNTSIFSYLNPLYLPLFLTAKGLTFTNRFLTGTFSRSNEYQADRGAVLLGADPLALITSLRKIITVVERSKLKAYNGDVPKPGMLAATWKKVTSTHPTPDRRYARLADLARTQGRSEAEIEKAIKGPIDIPADNDMPYEVIKKLVVGL